MDSLNRMRDASLVAVALLVGCAPTPANPIQGAWTTEQYVLANGPTHRLSGHILFAEEEWTVLFFVLGDEEPQRGSAEGGTYTLDGDNLVFKHYYNLSVGSEMEGLDEAPLRMVARERGTGPDEPSTIDVTDDVLTIFFPSGNSMVFHRLPR